MMESVDAPTPMDPPDSGPPQMICQPAVGPPATRDAARWAYPCLAVTSVLVVTAWMWAISWPGGTGLLQFAITLVAGCVFMVWIVAFGLHMAGRSTNRTARDPGSPTARVHGTWALAVSGFAWLAAVPLNATNAPLRVRFELSRPAFDQAALTAEEVARTAAQQQRSQTSDTGELIVESRTRTPERLGLYPGGQVTVVGTNTIVDLDSRLAAGGFARFPDGWPKSWDDGENDARRISLGDGWWAYWWPSFSLDF